MPRRSAEFALHDVVCGSPLGQFRGVVSLAPSDNPPHSRPASSVARQEGSGALRHHAVLVMTMVAVGAVGACSDDDGGAGIPAAGGGGRAGSAGAGGMGGAAGAGGGAGSGGSSGSASGSGGTASVPVPPPTPALPADAPTVACPTVI